MTKSTLFKVIDTTNGNIIDADIDFYEARFKVEKNENYTLMNQDADITDMLQRRLNYIEATKDLEEEF